MPRAPLIVLLVAGLLGALPASALAAGEKPVRPTNRALAESTLDRVERLRAGQGVRSGRELTPALAALNKRQGALSEADQRRARGALARPTDGAADPLGDGYTVAEHTPYCTTNFCFHWVTSTNDAPNLTDSDSDGVPNFVEQMAAEFENVRAVENGSMGWVTPKSDGTKGGDARTDVYLKDIGDQGIFGYAAPEQGSVSSYAYLVMDDDYSEFAPLTPLAAMQVTAAHEYNHVLQFTYDSIQDTWMLESTATWSENHVYPAIDDYLNYLDPWVACTEAPLTSADPPGTACDLKMYGSAVWQHYFESRYGQDAIREAWERSDVTSPEAHFAPDAYDETSAAHSGAGFADEFGRFAASVAEWEAPASPFPDHVSYPDVERQGASLTLGAAGRTVTLDHTTFALIDVVPDGSQPSLELRATAPAGLNSSVALVGRTGSDPHAGTVTSVVQHLPAGGNASVSLPNPGDYGRITAVLANDDVSHSGFSGSDWVWTRDAQPFSNVRVVAPGTPSDPAPGGGSSSPPATTTTTAALPAPVATPPALASKIALRSPQRRSTAIKRGVLVRVRCNQSCRARVELRISRSTARRLRLSTVIGTRTVTLSSAGVKSFRVKLSRRARRKLARYRSIRVSARMRATRGSARTGLHTARLTIRR